MLCPPKSVSKEVITLNEMCKAEVSPVSKKKDNINIKNKYIWERNTAYKSVFCAFCTLDTKPPVNGLKFWRQNQTLVMTL